MKKRAREPKPILPVLASAVGPALIKHLASCNTVVRSQSLKLIQSWLKGQTELLSGPDVKKLWKGLFYCMWHADKTPNQVALINRLTSLFLSLQPSLALEYFRGFLVTLRREWPGIDRLRLDKFYLLIRRFISTLFELVKLRKWDVAVLGEYFEVLEKDGFLAEDKLQGNGVNYHLVSVFLEELKAVGFPVRKEVIDVIFGPFCEVMKRGKDKILLGKVKSCLFDELVKMGKELLEKKKMGLDCDEKDGDVLLGIVALRMELSGRLYQVGSSSDCIQGNKKVVLGLHEEFLKLEKDFQSSGVEIVVPEYSNSVVADDLDEVPELIPIKGSNEDEDNRVFKKNKKAKKVEDGNDKKNKKAIKVEDGNDKKKNKKKKQKRKDNNNGGLEINPPLKENGDLDRDSSSDNLHLHSVSDDIESDGSELVLNEIVISNLQKQFEKVADVTGSDDDEYTNFSDTPISAKHSKKKRRKSADGEKIGNPKKNTTEEDGGKSGSKSEKRVRFAMKNNLVWKPQTPLPPESLRLPPSVTPRGSALKKGVPPGPVVEMPSTTNKRKQQQQQKKKKKKAKVRMISMSL